MASALVIVQSLLPILCSSNLPLAPGDLVQLSLDVVSDPSLPAQIEGVVQNPVGRVRMLGEDQCVTVGYAYTVAYETDDLAGALAELPSGLITAVGCITCCEKLNANLGVERVARIAGDAALSDALAAETEARIAGDAAITRTAAEGSPNIPDSLTLSGPATAGVAGIIPRAANLNGFSSWQGGGNVSIYHDGESLWIIKQEGATLTYFASIDSMAVSPVGLSGWLVEAGSGEPVVTGVGVTPARIGHPLLLGGPLSTNRVPFIATSVDPPIWQISGPFAESTSAPGTYVEIGFNGTTVTFDPYPLS